MNGETNPLRTSDFDYCLPPDRIAQTPAEPRDSSRLLVLRRAAPAGSTAIEHRRFRDIVEYVHAGDLLVANETRVIPARLFARKRETGGRVEVLLVSRREAGLWEALVKPGRRVREGTVLEFGGATPRPDLPGASSALPAQSLVGEVVGRTEAGVRLIRFSRSADADAVLERLGAVPLPPYIHQKLADPERYQTVYARHKGSVAAPTAGLHFTPELMELLRAKGVDFRFVTLHIGLDTFRPVQVEDAREHHMHSEYATLPVETAIAINQAKAEGRRVIAIGTTAVRVLETAGLLAEGALRNPRLQPLAEGKPEDVVLPFAGWTDIFIYPGYRFRVVDALITNFHLPRSTLLMLVSAFAGRERILQAYEEAVREGYRFYSFGDAMFIL